MKTCAAFRGLLLEAEPHELRGEGESPLAAHVRACPGCTRRARVVLAETARLEAHLAAEPGDLDVEAILARAALSGPAPGRAARAGAPGRRRGPVPGGHWTWVAAAAAVAFLLLLPGGPQVPPPSVPALATPQPPLVEPAAGQSVAVLQTDNPEITVLWFF